MDFTSPDELLLRAEKRTQDKSLQSNLRRGHWLYLFLLGILGGLFTYAIVSSVVLYNDFVLLSETFPFLSSVLGSVFAWDVFLVVLAVLLTLVLISRIWLKTRDIVTISLASIIVACGVLSLPQTADFMPPNPSAQLALASLETRLKKENKDTGTIASVTQNGDDFLVIVKKLNIEQEYRMPNPPFTPKPGDSLWLTYDSSFVPPRIVDMGLLVTK